MEEKFNTIISTGSACKSGMSSTLPDILNIPDSIRSSLITISWDDNFSMKK